VRFAPLNVKTILNDVINLQMPAAREKGIEFQLDIADGTALSSDRDLLRLIFQNLVSNTIKHGRKTGGKVQITVRPRDGGGCVLKVTDEGPGISPDAIPGLFDLAVSSPGKSKSSVRLGLPVSKQAADMIGATLTAESVLGVGTMITLEVPDHPNGKDPNRSRVA
jgi:two-component system cell cycle sensor histidine kinase PleC